ncbi:DUF2760 domain-containing protein [Defluviicoccus vanus]|uniref:DUF2760 domain-containing protein n=2 Tax=Defluviicoccus vanus TaxID=111831 RepID=A0A7H1N6D2_9PROT|nr:DUF2760 domain-containing protein [Defluviicoccus vanus]
MVPQTAIYQPQLIIGALAAAVVAFLSALLQRPGSASPAPVVAEAARPVAPPPPAAKQAEAEVVSFLAVLQDKGRLVDFLMDDISAYNNEQVGAAARVVHSGCKAALQDHIRIRPVRDEKEGARITVAPGYAADEYRLIGKISGEPPFSGTLIHRGWKPESVKLPRVLHSGGDRLPTIAPAEVELK